MNISPSSFVTFKKCSQWFKWQYIDLLEPDESTDNIYALFGTTFHKAMQLHHKFNLSYDELVSSWKTLFLSYCTDAKRFAWPKDDVIDSFLAKGYIYLKNAFKMRKRWKKYAVLDTERYVRLDFQNKFLPNIGLSGKIDLLLKDEQSIVNLDWKTSKRKEADINFNDQLTFYIYFIHVIYKLPLDVIYGALAYPFDEELLFTQRTQEQIDSMLESVLKVLKRLYENDIAKEPKRDFLIDNCMFCPYPHRCEKQ